MACSLRSTLYDHFICYTKKFHLIPREYTKTCFCQFMKMLCLKKKQFGVKYLKTTKSANRGHFLKISGGIIHKGVEIFLNIE